VVETDAFGIDLEPMRVIDVTDERSGPIDESVVKVENDVPGPLEVGSGLEDAAGNVEARTLIARNATPRSFLVGAHFALLSCEA